MEAGLGIGGSWAEILNKGLRWPCGELWSQDGSSELSQDNVRGQAFKARTVISHWMWPALGKVMLFRWDNSWAGWCLRAVCLQCFPQSSRRGEGRAGEGREGKGSEKGERGKEKGGKQGRGEGKGGGKEERRGEEGSGGKKKKEKHRILWTRLIG